MSATGHAARMAATYSTGAFARTVAAGGNPGLMNLGFADDPHRPGSTARRQRRLAELVLAAISPAPGQVLLDVGCGKGGMANLIGRLAPRARVMGVNIDRHQLAIARRRQVSRGRVHYWRRGAAPFRDCCFRSGVRGRGAFTHRRQEGALR